MKKPVHRAWAYAAVFLGLIAASLGWDRYRIGRALEDVFHYSYRITLQDSDTREVLPAGVASPPTSSTDLFHQSQSTIAYPDGSVTISGVGYSPRTFNFAAEGYGSKSITITPKCPFTDHIRIKLKKKSMTETKRSQHDGSSNGG